MYVINEFKVSHSCGQNLLSSQFLRPFLLNSMSWELLICHSPVSVKQGCRWCRHHSQYPILILITLNSGCLWRSPLVQDFLVPQHPHWVSAEPSFSLLNQYLVSTPSGDRVSFVSWNLNFHFINYKLFNFLKMSYLSNLSFSSSKAPSGYALFSLV